MNHMPRDSVSVSVSVSVSGSGSGSGRVVGLVTRLASLAVIAVLAQGCGFFESAGEITLGKGQIPRVQEEIDWPDIDKMTGSALTASVGDGKGEALITGVPTSLKKGTLAHVQGILALAGDCQRTFTQAKVGENPKSAVSNLAVRVTNCTGDARCEYLCNGFRGIEMEAAVEIELLSAAKAKDLAKQLQQASPDAAVEAIVQIRLQFFKLELYQKGNDDKREVVTERLSSLDLILTETGVEQSVGEIVAQEADRAAARDQALKDGVDLDESKWDALPRWVSVLDQRHVASISPETPQRFEIDPQSALLKQIKLTVVDGKRTALRLVQRIRVDKPELYELRFDGAGVAVDVQPEVIVSVLQLVKNLGASAAGQ